MAKRKGGGIKLLVIIGVLAGGAYGAHAAGLTQSFLEPDEEGPLEGAPVRRGDLRISEREIRDVTRAFKAMMSIHEGELEGEDVDAAEAPEVKLGDLEALRGVVKFPVRIKCATLSWNTLAEALNEVTEAD